jgi:hypothetical protein
MLDWIQVAGSSRIVAMAYDATSETIYVRFPNNTEWFYAGCPQQIWEEFSGPNTSKGQYISTVLNGHPNGRWVG